MSILANTALSGALAAFGFGAGSMVLTLTAPAPVPFAAPVPSADTITEYRQTSPLEPVWPAVFGLVPPAPVVPAAPPPAPEPEIRYDYQLTGLVVDAYSSWAMISLGGVQSVVRVGDELEGGEIVTKIDNRGVWVTWRGLAQLIPVQKTDTTHMVQDLAADDPDTPPRDLGGVSVILERLDRATLSRSFDGAGSLVLTVTPQGMPALDVVWIRQGALYDRMGLRTGDKILRVNGENVDKSDLLAYVPDTITNGGSIDLEILRDGIRQIIKVNLGQG